MESMKEKRIQICKQCGEPRKGHVCKYPKQAKELATNEESDDDEDFDDSYYRAMLAAHVASNPLNATAADDKSSMPLSSSDDVASSVKIASVALPKGRVVTPTGSQSSASKACKTSTSSNDGDLKSSASSPARSSARSSMSNGSKKKKSPPASPIVLPPHKRHNKDTTVASGDGVTFADEVFECSSQSSHTSKGGAGKSDSAVAPESALFEVEEDEDDKEVEREDDDKKDDDKKLDDKKLDDDELAELKDEDEHDDKKVDDKKDDDKKDDDDDLEKGDADRQLFKDDETSRKEAEPCANSDLDESKWIKVVSKGWPLYEPWSLPTVKEVQKTGLSILKQQACKEGFNCISVCLDRNAMGSGEKRNRTFFSKSPYCLKADDLFDIDPNEAQYHCTFYYLPNSALPKTDESTKLVCCQKIIRDRSDEDFGALIRCSTNAPVERTRDARL